MRKLSAPVRFLQKLHVYVFFIFLRSPQCGIFTKVAFDTAKGGREQFICIFRTSQESQKRMKSKEKFKKMFLLAPKCCEITSDLLQCPKRPPLPSGVL